MRLKDSTRPNVEQKRQIQRQQQQIGCSSGPTKQNLKSPRITTPKNTETKRKHSRTIQDDSDEGIDPTPIKRKSLRNSIQRNSNINNDNHIVTTIENDDDDDTSKKNKNTHMVHDDDSVPASNSDVFDDFTVLKSPTPIRHKKRRHMYEGIDDPKSYYEAQVGPSSPPSSPWGPLTGESSTSSCRQRAINIEKKLTVSDNEDEDDFYDKWIAQMGNDQKHKGRPLNNDNKTDYNNNNKDDDVATSNLSSNLILPRRRKAIVFHEDPDDIPVKESENTTTHPTTITYDSNSKPMAKTTNLQSKDIRHTLGRTRPLTRSTAKSLDLQKSLRDGFSYGMNSVRGLFGQPQHITIDDDEDDDDVQIQDSSLSTSTFANGQELLFHYPSSAPGGVAVIREDANRLMDGQMLNDSIIDFYVKWLLINTDNNSSSSSLFGDDDERPITERIHIFNTFFFARLKQPTKGDPYENVKKWASKINLFEKDIVFIPIHEASHWYLLVVCNLKKCIPKEGECIDLSNDKSDKAIVYSLDSMGLKRTKSASRVIKYLNSAAHDRLGIDPKQFIKPVYVQANVPLQPNAYDCGIYVLHFIEMFLQQPEKIMSILTAKDLDDTVWRSAKIAEKRELISDLITGLCQSPPSPLQNNADT
ncbi:hypothetical protein BDC45DRAFT_156364 [Circinella umbellata]|nr:hypothetical protein BDC45DRAFT_156364 [Circinella umbellata]